LQSRFPAETMSQMLELRALTLSLTRWDPRQTPALRSPLL
jgi:hypothetical protein